MADNRIQLPSSGGGLLRYSEEVKSRFMIGPYVVIGIIVAIAVFEILLYKMG